MLVDEIWHAAGDVATDVDWYAKRAVLGAIYSVTEVYMLTDSSPGMFPSLLMCLNPFVDVHFCLFGVFALMHIGLFVAPTQTFQIEYCYLVSLFPNSSRWHLNHPLPNSVLRNVVKSIG